MRDLSIAEFELISGAGDVADAAQVGGALGGGGWYFLRRQYWGVR